MKVEIDEYVSICILIIHRSVINEVDVYFLNTCGSTVFNWLMKKPLCTD